jgi:hypothetical protein
MRRWVPPLPLAAWIDHRSRARPARCGWWPASRVRRAVIPAKNIAPGSIRRTGCPRPAGNRVGTGPARNTRSPSPGALRAGVAGHVWRTPTDSSQWCRTIRTTPGHGVAHPGTGRPARSRTAARGDRGPAYTRGGQRTSRRSNPPRRHLHKIAGTTRFGVRTVSSSSPPPVLPRGSLRRKTMTY